MKLGGDREDHRERKRKRETAQVRALHRVLWEAKRLSEEALQIPEKRREAKNKREKERYTHLDVEF